MPSPGLGFDIAADALGILEGGFELISNIGKEKKAKAELAKLTPAFYRIQDEYLQNRNVAADQAQTGLPQATKDAADIERRRGLSTGIGALIQSGANPNDIATLLGTYDTAVDRTAAADAQAKLDNIKYFMSVNKDLAGQKTIQWGYNEELPYERKLKEITDRRAAAQQNQITGANTVIGATSALGTSLQNSDLNNSKKVAFDKLFNSGGSTAGVNIPNVNTREIAAQAGNTAKVFKPYDTGINSPDDIQAFLDSILSKS